MDLLSQYLQPGTRNWNSVRSYVTNSTRIDLLRRIIQYGSDVATLREIHLHQPARAAEILSSRSFLTTLIGHMVNFIEESEVQNRNAFLNEYETMLPRWDRIVSAFDSVNADLKTHKYTPKSDDPNKGIGPNPVYQFQDSYVSTFKTLCCFYLNSFFRRLLLGMDLNTVLIKCPSPPYPF